MMTEKGVLYTKLFSLTMEYVTTFNILYTVSGWGPAQYLPGCKLVW